MKRPVGHPRFVDPARDNPEAEGFVPIEQRSLAEQARWFVHSHVLTRRAHRAVLDRSKAPPADSLPRWHDGSRGYLPPPMRT